jgi:hypothetical protein
LQRCIGLLIDIAFGFRCDLFVCVSDKRSGHANNRNDASK